jgi:hypothetical protein
MSRGRNERIFWVRMPSREAGLAVEFGYPRILIDSGLAYTGLKDESIRTNPAVSKIFLRGLRAQSPQLERDEG